MALFEGAGPNPDVAGLDAVSFRKVAAVLGCSYTALYSYFPNKEALINSLRARSFIWIRTAMLNVIDPQASYEEQLKTLSSAYIQAALDRPQRYSLMFFDLDQTDAAKHSLELRSAKRNALDVCTQVIAAGQAAGEFPPTVDALTAAHLFWAGAHGLVSLQVAGQFVMGRDIANLQPLFIAVLRAGLELPAIEHSINNDPLKIESGN